MKRLLVILLVIAVVVGISVVSQRRTVSTAEVVQTEGVSYQFIESTVLATGVLAYGDERSVRSEVTALVKAVLVDEGDIVTQGQRLIELESDALNTDLDSQKVTIALRKIEIERANLRLKTLKDQQVRLEKLYAQQATQISNLEDNMNQIRLAEVDIRMQEQLLVQARLSVDKVQEQINKTVIKAPADGLISALDIKAGEMAVAGGAGQPLLVMVDPDVIYTDIDVDEADIGGVEEGQRVKVFAVSFPDVAIEGVVQTIATSARTVPGRSALVFPVRVRIIETTGIHLRPGMSTRSEIIQPSDQENWVVPIEAIRDNAAVSALRAAGGDGMASMLDNRSGPEFSVFIYDSGRAKEVGVTLGKQDDRFQAILSGVSAEDLVITGPYRVLRALRDGDAVMLQAVGQ